MRTFDVLSTNTEQCIAETVEQTMLAHTSLTLFLRPGGKWVAACGEWKILTHLPSMYTRIDTQTERLIAIQFIHSSIYRIQTRCGLAVAICVCVCVACSQLDLENMVQRGYFCVSVCVYDVLYFDWRPTEKSAIHRPAAIGNRSFFAQDGSGSEPEPHHT